LGSCTDAGGVHGVALDFLRQRSDQRYAGMRQDLADLVNSKLGLAGLDVIGYIATLFELFLRLDLIRYAEALEQPG
jgi:hypothetical protein